MSVTGFSISDYISSTLTAPGDHTQGIGFTYWAKIATADTPTQYATAAHLKTATDQYTLSCDCSDDDVVSTTQAQTRGTATPIPRDTWALCTHWRNGTSVGGYNSLYAAWSTDGSFANENTATPPLATNGNEDWTNLFLGVDGSGNSTQVFTGKLEDAAAWSCTKAEFDTIRSALWGDGTHKRADNIASIATPIWHAFLFDDKTSGTGGALVETGTLTVDASDSPILEAPTPVNPVFSAGPTVGTITETSIQSVQTPSEDCTIKVVAVAGTSQPEPSQATYDATPFQQTVTGGTNTTITVTGLTGLTAYTIWVQLDPAVGTESSATFNASTVAAPPTITTVNGGDPVLTLGETITVTGSGFTGHVQATIDGTVQSGFTVVNDTTVTFTATRATTLEHGVNGTLNIGGTTDTVQTEPQTGYSYVNLTGTLAPKAQRIDAGQAWDLVTDVDQVEWDTKGGTVIVGIDGTVTSTIDQSFTWQVHDGTDWGSVGAYTVGGFSLTYMPRFGMRRMGMGI